jgi:hypothetical protein
MKKIIALSTLLAFGALGMACGDTATNNTAVNANKTIANAVNQVANAANQAATAANAAANQAATAANAISNAANAATANKPAGNTAANSNSNK